MTFAIVSILRFSPKDATCQDSGRDVIFAPIIRLIFNVWRVKSEYSADQAGLIACRDLEAAVMTMLKLAAGPDVDVNVDFRQFIQNIDDDTAAPQSRLMEFLGDHPFASNRIRELVKFRQSNLYR
ncbi:MAG: M48 family metalloprotease [Bacteroidetes bacterium]|nr:M48 family metalloprotease [Bacteroidota bacterium]